MSPEDARKVRRARGNPFDHVAATAIERVDIGIPAGDVILPARIYQPSSVCADRDGLQPALVYFHGGGFVFGDIESYDRPLALMASLSKTTIISVEYRLAPETRFPGAVEDAQQAFNWVYQNAEDLGLDPDLIAIGGDSAGGNLSGATSMLNRDAGLPMPCMQVLLYPSTIGNGRSSSRERFADGLLLSAETLQWFHGHYIAERDQDDPRFNLMAADDFRQLPPTFVITAGFDPLRDEGEAYALALREAGVPVRHSCYSDMFHAFLNFGVLAQSRAAVFESAQLLAQCLDPQLGQRRGQRR